MFPSLPFPSLSLSLSTQNPFSLSPILSPSSLVPKSLSTPPKIIFLFSLSLSLDLSKLSLYSLSLDLSTLSLSTLLMDEDHDDHQRSPKPDRDRSSTAAAAAAAEASSTTTSIHVTALDGVVNVNSLFTVAVFVGLSLTTPGQGGGGQGGGCSAGPDVARNLLAFEVVSFSFFLFSSLVAQGLKLALNLINSNDPHDAFRARIDARVLRLGMLASAAGSVMGCVFLLLSMVDVIQIRLGMLSCGAAPAVRSVAALLALVSVALAVYVSTVFYAFTH